MKKYPYIQEKRKITNFICDTCEKQIENGFNVEWRVDIFQGNCEFESVCATCLNKDLQQIKNHWIKREKAEQEREAKYEARMKPKWDKLEELLQENNIEVKKYEQTGQWTLNNLIDWWTTTGTAINRKTKQRFYFTVENPYKIIKSVL